MNLSTLKKELRRIKKLGFVPTHRTGDMGIGKTLEDLLNIKNMSIIINIDVMLAKRKMSVTELAEKVGITMANISVLKNGKAKAIRLSTLEAICKALECQPGDILEYKK